MEQRACSTFGAAAGEMSGQDRILSELAEAIIRIAAQLHADPRQLGADLDQAIVSRLASRRIAHIAQVPSSVVEAILQAAWFEALSRHAPHMTDDDIERLSHRVLDEVCCAIVLGAAGPLH